MVAPNELAVMVVGRCGDHRPVPDFQNDDLDIQPDQFFQKVKVLHVKLCQLADTRSAVLLSNQLDQ